MQREIYETALQGQINLDSHGGIYILKDILYKEIFRGSSFNKEYKYVRYLI